MYAILGKVEFDLITYFDGLETQFGADYAEHALIGRKPRLQHVGDRLDEVKIDLVFHVNYCSPEAELVRLRNALASHEALSLVLGNGDYKGRFVITNITATGRHTDTDGTLLSLDAQMTLREYTGDPAQPPAPAVRPAGSIQALPAKGGLVKALPAALKVPAGGASGLARAVTAAKGALAGTVSVLSAVKAVQGLAGANPMAALTRLPGVIGSVSAVLPKLDGAAAQLGAMQSVGKYAGDAGAVTRSIIQVRASMASLGVNLGGATTGNVLSKLTSASGAANSISGALQASSLPLARLTAQAVTRMG